MKFILPVISKRMKILYLMSILTISALMISISVPHAFHDKDKSHGWRIQQDIDDGLNSDRGADLIINGYGSNKTIQVGMQQFNLLLGSFTQKLLGPEYSPHTRMLIILRLQAIIFFSMVMFLFYFLFRSFFSEHISFYLWILWFCGVGTYAPITFRAKEDALCLIFVILTLICWKRFIDKKSIKYLYYSAVCIGLGTATKQYPAFLVLGFLPIVFSIETAWKNRFIKLLQLGIISGITFFAVNPNFFMGPFSFFSNIRVLVVDQMTVNTDLIGRLKQAISIYFYVGVVHLFHFWLALVFFVVLWVIHKRKKMRWSETKSFSTLRGYKTWIAAFVLLYYVVSLYKQHQFKIPKYFLVGEVVLLIVLGIFVEMFWRIENKKLRNFALTLFIPLSFLGAVSDFSDYKVYLGIIRMNLGSVVNSTSDQLEKAILKHSNVPKLKILTDYLTYFSSERIIQIPVWGVSYESILEKKPDFVVLNSFGYIHYSDVERVYSDTKKGDGCLSKIFEIEGNENLGRIKPMGELIFEVLTLIYGSADYRKSLPPSGLYYVLLDPADCLKNQ